MMEHRSRVRGTGGMVAAGHPDAVRAGAHAFDAIVATFASCGVEPAQSAAGGDVRLAAREGRLVPVDGRLPEGTCKCPRGYARSRRYTRHHVPARPRGRRVSRPQGTISQRAFRAPSPPPRSGPVPEASIRLAERGITMTWNRLLHICEVHRAQHPGTEPGRCGPAPEVSHFRLPLTDPADAGTRITLPPVRALSGTPLQSRTPMARTDLRLQCGIIRR